MPLSIYALTNAELLRTKMGAEGIKEDPRLETAINAASKFIETRTNRQFITRGAATEYHSLYSDQHTITLAHGPIISVTSVHESTSSPRVYDSTTLLTSATDYLAVSTPERAVIRRLSSAELYLWATGYRTIQVVYDYGYADIDGLPDDLAALAEDLSWALYKQADRGWDGITSRTDAQGSFTRIGRLLTADMRETLESYQRIEFQRTWEAA